MPNTVLLIRNDPFEDTLENEPPIELGGIDDYEVSDSSQLVEYDGPNANNIDPEAPVMYSKPGVFIESRYRSAIYGYTYTRYEELKLSQQKLSDSALYPFHSLQEYELVRFIWKAGLTHNEIEELLKIKFVSLV